MYFQDNYSVWVYLLIIVSHWIFDFCFQSNEQTQNKSKSLDALTSHVAIYTIFLTLIFGLTYGVVNGVLHFITDYNTSKWTKKLSGKGDWHNFFVVIGFDQVLHYIALFLTIPLIWWV